MKNSSFLILFGFLMLFGSCGRDGVFETEVEDIPIVPVELRDMSVLGFVTDRAGNPLEGVIVSLGEISVNTNKEGIYYFEKIGVSTTGSILKATKFLYDSELALIKPNILGILQVDFQLKRSSSNLVSNISAVSNKLQGVYFSVDVNHASLVKLSGQNSFQALLSNEVASDSISPILLPASIKPKTNQDIEIVEQFELQVRNSNGNNINKSDTVKHLMSLKTNDQSLFRMDRLRGVWILEKPMTSSNLYGINQDNFYGIGKFTTRFTVSAKLLNSKKEVLKGRPYFIKSSNGKLIFSGYTDSEGNISARLPNNTDFVIEIAQVCNSSINKIASGKVSGQALDLGSIVYNGSTKINLGFKLCENNALPSMRTPYTVQISQGKISTKLLMVGATIEKEIDFCAGSGLIEVKAFNGANLVGSITFSEEQIKNGKIDLSNINLCQEPELFGKFVIGERSFVYKSSDYKIIKQDENDIGITDFGDLTIILSNVKEKGIHKISRFSFLKQPILECKGDCNELKAEVIRFGNVGQVFEVKITGKINNKNIDCHLKNIRFS